MSIFILFLLFLLGTLAALVGAEGEVTVGRIMEEFNTHLANRHKNRELLNYFMQPDAMFYGCNWHYNQREMSDLLLRIPGEIHITFESSHRHRDYAYGAFVKVTGMGAPIHAHLKLEYYTEFPTRSMLPWILEAEELDCYNTSRRLNADSQDLMSDPNLVVKPWLAQFNNALTNRHVSGVLKEMIAKDFYFESCFAPEDERDFSLSKIMGIPSTTNIIFHLESAGYDRNYGFHFVTNVEGMPPLYMTNHFRARFSIGVDVHTGKYVMASGKALDCH